MRAGSVVLWDVDGTILRARGAGVACFRAALAAVGREWPTGRLDFGGRTDLDIAAALIAASAPGAGPSTPTELLRHVELEYARRAAEFARDTVLMPNVAEVIAAVDACGVVQTVVTGNVRSIARHKLAAVGQADGAVLRLELGAFGDDHADRSQLVALARARARAAGHDVAPRSCWVIGDTPRDLAAARAVGVRCALVATGTYGHDELAALGPDLVFGDLRDAEPLIAALA